MTRDEFLTSMHQAAVEARAAGAPINAVIAAAQAALESRWGESELYRKARNAFGIKGQYQGSSITLPTLEQLPDGSWVRVDAEFRPYPSLEACFEDYGSIIQRLPWYQDAEDAKNDPRRFLEGLIAKRDEFGEVVEPGWATDQGYFGKVWSIVEKYGLLEKPEEPYFLLDTVLLHDLEVPNVGSRLERVFRAWRGEPIRVPFARLDGRFAARVRPKTEGEGLKMDVASTTQRP